MLDVNPQCGTWRYDEPATTLRLLFLTMLIGSLVGLELETDQ